MKTAQLELIRPDWTVSPRVRAWSTTRYGGASNGPFASLNLATHVGDDPTNVADNRRLLRGALKLPTEPVWLEQVHGIRSLDLDNKLVSDPLCADASLTHTPGIVCAVLTADCLPVLLCERSGRAVAAVHAGWRGLVAGIIEQTLERLDEPPSQLAAWLGPAIGATAFEVGGEVREAFLAADTEATRAFAPSPSGRWFADLYALARRRLFRAGVADVSGAHYCTCTDSARFFSYRRDQTTGRMASLIWLAHAD